MSDTGGSDDSQDNGTSDSDTPASVLGGISLKPWIRPGPITKKICDRNRTGLTVESVRVSLIQ